MIDKPNYTQMPNLFFDDLMRYMGEAELKVTMAIARETFGYHRESKKIGLTALQEMTGMSRQGVINGINAGLERGTLGREPVEGGGYLYRIIISGEASQRSRPPLVNEVDQNTPDLKKEVKETTTKKGEEKPPTPKQEMYLATCEALGWDYKVIAEDDKCEAAEAVKLLHSAGYTAADIRRFMSEVWFYDWRWEKDQQRPTLKQLRQGIGKLRQSLPEHVPRKSKLSEAEKSKLLSRATSARSLLKTAEKFGGQIDPQWQADIDKAKEYGLI